MNDLVEIYSTSEDSFAVGSIIYENEKYLLIKAVDDQGKPDGYLLFDRTFINSIEKDTVYLDKIKKYMPSWQDLKFGRSSDEIYTKNPDFKNLITYSKDKNKIISLATGANYFDFLTGLVKAIYDEGLDLEAIDQNSGEVYGDFYISFDDIKVLEIESIDLYLLGISR